jgi:hypothetical protein
LRELIPISLGWNCSPAIYRGNTLNFKKANGYLTCPFDLGVTPYTGLCQCILDDFNKDKFFNLRVEYDPINKQDCILNEYDMWFNHESEKKEGNSIVLWHPGKFQTDNFKLFKERYEQRILNFINYINNHNILFILENTFNSPMYIYNILKFKYPNLNFKLLIINFNPDIYFSQSLHSPSFPKSNEDNEYINNFLVKFKQFENF